MATNDSGQSTPFLGGEDRPEVYSLLDKPIRDLTPRQLSTVFSALGIPSGPKDDPIGAGDIGDVPPEEYPDDPCAWNNDFQREQILAELVAAGASMDDIKGMDPDELIVVAQKYNISATTMAQLGGLKQIFDKVRRDKPIVDKAIKDAKTAGDKIIRDNKPTVDKVIRDGKTWVDKQVRDKGVAKDASDAKQIKELVDAVVVVTPVGDDTTVAQLAQQVESLRAQFDAISQTIQQLQSGQS